MLYIVDSTGDKTNSFGIVGAVTNLTDDNGAALFVGDIVKVTHKKTKWSKLRMVCYKDYAYIQGVPHVHPEDKKDFICEKVIDSGILTDGFQLYNNLITSELKDKTEV